MSRLLLRSILSVSLLTPVIAGCGPAYADRIAVPQARPLIPIAVAPEAVRSPYQVEIISDGGDTLDTFFKKGRYYVHGANGEAYTIRVSNPTAQRIEAVVSVDGLDVIDGESGDVRKRGYVVPAYGEVRIEGWRTSLDNVAAFRFSSVGGSYAGKKGKARNVGVIAVALFAEEAPAQIIVEDPPPPPEYYDDDGDGYGEGVDPYLDRRVPSSGTKAGNVSSRGSAGKDQADGRSVDHAAAKRPAVPPPDVTAAQPPRPTAEDSVGESGGGSPGTASVSVHGAVAPSEQQPVDRDECCTQEKERLGLGTEYGEQRTSSASYTRFVRSSDRPVAVAELRYNDTAGLKALGILVDPEPDANEIMTRETADPFPGDRGFARPPAGIR